MPELSDSTPPTNPPSPDGSSPGKPPRRPMPQLIPPEPPAKSVASEWEMWEGFRFTFLGYFKPEDVAALRAVAQLLYNLILETPSMRQDYPPPSTRWEMVAVLSELRFLQGYLSTVSASRRLSSLPEKVEKLCEFAGGLAWELSGMGDRLNDELGKWRDE